MPGNVQFGCKMHPNCTQFHLISLRQIIPVTLLESMAGTTGLEPATSAVTVQRLDVTY